MNGQNRSIYFLAASVALLMVANARVFLGTKSLEADARNAEAAIMSEIAAVRDEIAQAASGHMEWLHAFGAEIESGKSRALVLAAETKRDAQRHAEWLAARLRERQRERRQAAEYEIAAAGAETAAAETRLKDVVATVGEVREQISDTDRAIVRLSGEVGQAGSELASLTPLVAHNTAAVNRLQAETGREIEEFQLTKSGRPVRVGDVLLVLKEADPKRNRYTVQLIADRRTVEQKDRIVNEPVRFFLADSGKPYELVIDSVGKDRVAGRLFTPTMELSRFSDALQ